MNSSTLLVRPLAAVALLVSSPGAQDPSYRTPTPLSMAAGIAPGTAAQPRLCAPKEDLPPLGVAGAVHTGQLVHATWVGTDDNGAANVYYRRSVDGGCSWEPAVSLWTAQTDEIIDTRAYRVLCRGHEVWVLLRTNRRSDGVPDLNPFPIPHAWVVASEQQGLPGTFQQLHVSTSQDIPLPTGDDGRAVAAVEAACGPGSLHVFWLMDYDFAVGVLRQSGGVADAYYQRVDFTGGVLTFGFARERNLESHPTGLVRTSLLDVCCENDAVAFVWSDDQGDISVRTSPDRGATLTSEERLIQQPIFPQRIDCEVFGPAPDATVMVVSRDDRQGPLGVFAHRSRQSGSPGTFEAGVRVDRSTADVLAMRACVTNDGTVYVTYLDDRASARQVYVVVDPNGGDDFAAGSQAETLLAAGDTPPLPPSIDGHGGYAAIALVDSAGAEPPRLAFTSDRGTTWSESPLAAAASVVSAAVCATTTRYDLVSSWLASPQGEEELFGGGRRVMSLRYEPASFAFVADRAGEPTDVAFLLASLAPPACGAFAIRPANGWQADFQPDALTQSTVSGPFVTTVGAQNTATWPGFPNFAGLIGAPIHWMVLSTGGRQIRAVSDTLIQNPPQ